MESMVLKGDLKVKPKLSVDQKMEDLIMIIFAKRMGKWDKELGSMINTVVEKKEHSDIFKTTVMYYFYRDFDVSKEYFRIVTF